MAPKDETQARLDQLESRLDKLDPPPPPPLDPVELLTRRVDVAESIQETTGNRLAELEQAHGEAQSQMVEHISDYLIQAGVAPRKQTKWHRLGNFLWNVATLAAMVGVAYLLLLHFHLLGAK